MSTCIEERFKKLLKLYFVHEYYHYHGSLVVQVRLFDLIPGVIAKDEYHKKLSFITIESPSKKSYKSINEELRVKAVENANALKKMKRMQISI